MTSVQVTVAGGRKCPRCGTRLCLTAQIGTAQVGQQRRTVALCPGCDAGNADAGPLLAYFADRPNVDPADRGRVADLLGRWLNSLPTSDTSPSLAEAAEAWWARRTRAAPELQP